jgi:hypothetical protein
VLRVGPFRFFFHAGDGGEPPHVHVERDDCEAKCWLDPIWLDRSHGFHRKEINRIRHGPYPSSPRRLLSTGSLYDSFVA